MKIKNARGDRVVHGAEFFQSIGSNTTKEATLEALWSSKDSALVFELSD